MMSGLNSVGSILLVLAQELNLALSVEQRSQYEVSASGRVIKRHDEAVLRSQGDGYDYYSAGDYADDHQYSYYEYGLGANSSEGDLDPGCCVYSKPNPCNNPSACVTLNGGRFVVDSSTCSDNAPNRFSCPIMPEASDLCPRHLIDESQWHYDASMWGRSGATDHQLEIGMRNAACVWAAVCQGNEACLSRCPVAMGIAGMESLFDASAKADDKGFGLWQVGHHSAPVEGLGLSETDAMNPLILGKWVRQVTNQGEYFSPKNRCWTTCEGTLCNPSGHSGWENGWVASWAAKKNGGAKAYSESSAVGDACTAVIQKMYPSLSWTTERFMQRDSCMVGEQVIVDPQR